jgi:hypothetical protein
LLVDKERLKTLQSLRRRIAENHPDGSAKERLLAVLDQMLLEADEEAL